MTAEPIFHRLPLTDLVDAGVLAIANRRFFWPLGLALTWVSEDGQASDLHIRQWSFEDGHIETIEDDESDGVMARRIAAFEEWRTARLARMPAEERVLAEAALPVPALDALTVERLRAILHPEFEAAMEAESWGTMWNEDEATARAYEALRKGETP